MEDLKTLRIQSGKTQKQVADEVGIQESAYQRYERGERVPNAKRACKIARALGTTVEAIYGSEE